MILRKEKEMESILTKQSCQNKHCFDKLIYIKNNKTKGDKRLMSYKYLYTQYLRNCHRFHNIFKI